MVVIPLGTLIGRALLIFNDFLRLGFESFLCLGKGGKRYKEIIKQMSVILFDSLGMILFCVAFASIVIMIEASYHMKLVIGDDSLVPGFASVLILRELGVVVMALLVTSKVGAGMAAEVSLMKNTEQLDALKMMGLDPIEFLVVPRLIAGSIALFILTFLVNVFCISCAMLVAEMKLGYTSGMFIQAIHSFVSIKDILFPSIKGFIFGGIIPWVSCFYGLRSKSGAEGVGSSTTHSVVVSSVVIIFLDFILTFIFSFFY